MIENKIYANFWHWLKIPWRYVILSNFKPRRGYRYDNVTCLASTLEECPLVTYLLDSGLPFREHDACS